MFVSIWAFGTQFESLLLLVHQWICVVVVCGFLCCNRVRSRPNQVMVEVLRVVSGFMNISDGKITVLIVLVSNNQGKK